MSCYALVLILVSQIPNSEVLGIYFNVFNGKRLQIVPVNSSRMGATFVII